MDTSPWLGLTKNSHKRKANNDDMETIPVAKRICLQDHASLGLIPPLYGRIRIRNTPSRQKGIVGSHYPRVPGYMNLSIWSRGAVPWKDLSPLTLGPVIYHEEDVEKRAENFECFWQGLKTYAHVAAQSPTPSNGQWSWPSEHHIDDKITTVKELKEKNNLPNPNAAWTRWRDALMKHPRGVRRPNGRHVPLYHFFQGEQLGLVEARKRIYIPYLQALYRAHPVYQKIMHMVQQGQSIILLEPDGPSFELYPDGMEVDLNLLYHLQHVTKLSDFPGGDSSKTPNKYVPYGHGMCCALTLLEDLSI